MRLSGSSLLCSAASFWAFYLNPNRDTLVGTPRVYL
jgi:hypothetical protein